MGNVFDYKIVTTDNTGGGYGYYYYPSTFKVPMITDTDHFQKHHFIHHYVECVCEKIALVDDEDLEKLVKSVKKEYTLRNLKKIDE